nr:helix-turn-helix domain-containing protein [Bacillus licheniformis]
MTNFGHHLRQLRERKKLTVNQLAMYSGVSSAGISRIENGKRGVPKPATIRKLADALKVPYEELMASAGYISASTVQEARSGYDSIYDIVSQYDLEDLSLFDSEKWKVLSKKDIENLDKYFDFLVQEASGRNKN